MKASTFSDIPRESIAIRPWARAITASHEHNRSTTTSQADHVGAQLHAAHLRLVLRRHADSPDAGFLDTTLNRSLVPQTGVKDNEI